MAGRKSSRIAVVVGTRPEIIKMSPIVGLCQRLKLNYVVIHSGQHYSPNLSERLLKDLGYPRNIIRLNVGSGSHAEETGRTLIKMERVLQNIKPGIVLVQGDTNTVLAAALSAAKLGIKVGHVEAGLRSHDDRMPEEINRKVADHTSSLLFAPTYQAKSNLLREGIEDSKVFVTGNTVVDALYRYLGGRETVNKNTSDRKGKAGKYLLATIHRQENLESATRFRKIIKALGVLHRQFRMPVIYAAHPRAQKRMRKLEIQPNALTIVDPVDYFSFVNLERDAELVITDSGGVQEECCILKVPCLTIRENTERPETLEVGSNVLSGVDPSEISEKAAVMMNRERSWKNPFGDGKAAERILALVEHQLEPSRKSLVRGRENPELQGAKLADTTEKEPVVILQ